MVTKHDLHGWIQDALRAHGGGGTVVDVCRYIWDLHERELRGSGNLFYTWQYDVVGQHRASAHRPHKACGDISSRRLGTSLIAQSVDSYRRVGRGSPSPTPHVEGSHGSEDEVHTPMRTKSPVWARGRGWKRGARLLRLARVVSENSSE
jgi:hypothetical protein